MDNDFVYFIRNFSRFAVMVDNRSESRFGFCILFALARNAYAQNCGDCRNGRSRQYNRFFHNYSLLLLEKF